MSKQVVTIILHCTSDYRHNPIWRRQPLVFSGGFNFKDICEAFLTIKKNKTTSNLPHPTVDRLADLQHSQSQAAPALSKRDLEYCAGYATRILRNVVGVGR